MILSIQKKIQSTFADFYDDDNFSGTYYTIVDSNNYISNLSNALPGFPNRATAFNSYAFRVFDPIEYQGVNKSIYIPYFEGWNASLNCVSAGGNSEAGSTSSNNNNQTTLTIGASGGGGSALMTRYLGKNDLSLIVDIDGNITLTDSSEINMFFKYGKKCNKWYCW